MSVFIGCLKLLSLIYTRWTHDSGCLAQLVERVPFKDDVAGSIPAAPTIFVRISF